MSWFGNLVSNQWGAATHPFQKNYYKLSNSFDTQNANAGDAASNPTPDDGSGTPQPPAFIPSYDPTTQSLSNANNPALTELNTEAMRTGPSKAANLMNLESDRQGLISRDNNAQTAGGNAAKARADLAARGGLSSGARERVEMNANNDVLNLNQKSDQQVQANKAQIGINDEQNRLGQLQTSAADKTSANMFDIGNQITEGNQVNAYNQNLYNQQMTAYGANQTANAQVQAASQGGSSFICTALREAGLMTDRESLRMTRFMLGAILSRADFFAWYFSRGKGAIEMAKRQNFDFSLIKEQYVDQILATEKEHGTVLAQSSYIMKAGSFCNQFLGECGYRDSMAQTGWLKSALALPKVFLLPQTWVWMKSYLGAKLERRVTKIYRKWSIL